METGRNQRFVSLDRAIEQNQCLNHVLAFVSHPPPGLDPTRSLGMPLTANRVYDNFPTCFVDGSRHGVLALLEEIDELGEDS